MSDKTKQEVNEIIRVLLQYPKEARNAHWKSNMDSLLPQAALVYNRMFSDDGNPQRHCIGLFPTEYPNSALAKTFTECAMTAAENRYGLMIMNNVEPDEYSHLLSYGGVWSYLNFDLIGGPINQVVQFDHALKHGAQDPMTHVINDSGRVSIAKPSDAFLPPAAKMAITQEIEASYPGAKVELWLHSQDNRAMPLSVMAEITGVPDDTSHDKAAQILRWHLPPLLRCGTIIHNLPSVTHALFGKGADELDWDCTNDANQEAEARYNQMRNEL